MSYRPPRWLESLAETLVPPAGAEHALGDLAESSNSTAQYTFNLFSILPSLVWCQIRRRSSIGAVLINAIVSGYLIGAAQAFFNAALLEQASGWLRLAAPWAIWVIAPVLSAAYGPADKPAKWNGKVFWAAVSAALVVAATVGAHPAAVATGIGIVIALTLVLTMPWINTSQVQTPVTLETLPEHARMFQKGIWWRNARESVAAILVLFFNARALWTAQSPLETAETLLVIMGVLFLLYNLQFRAGSRPVPEGSLETVFRFHRSEVARQRDVLLSVPFWYLLPLVPGIVMGVVNNWAGPPGLSSVALLAGVLALVAGVFALIWRLNSMGARWLDQQLKNIDALGGKIQ